MIVNPLAFMQARAMTRFVEKGERAGAPERLRLIDGIGVLLCGVRSHADQPAHAAPRRP